MSDHGQTRSHGLTGREANGAGPRPHTLTYMRGGGGHCLPLSVVHTVSKASVDFFLVSQVSQQNINSKRLTCLS